MLVYAGLYAIFLFGVLAGEKFDLWSGILPTERGTPVGRRSHTMVAHHEHLLVYGGYDGLGLGRLGDLHKYDVKANSWSELKPSGTEPDGRQFHTALLFEDDMYIFGGASKGKNLNDLQKYNVIDNSWTEVNTKGDTPSGRLGHTAVSPADDSPEMYIFGGFDGVPFNDLYKYNTKTMTWTELRPDGKPPPARHWHSAVTIGTDMWVFGGYDDGVFFNDMYSYNFKTNAWAGPHITQNRPPTPRQSLRAVVDGNEIVYFGGMDNSRHFNSVIRFHTVAMSWVSDEILPHSPEARSEHAMALIGSDMYLFGGEPQLDDAPYLNDLHKLSLNVFGEPPTSISLQWTIPSSAYPPQEIHVGDEIVFEYGAGHNVRLFPDEDAYDSCDFSNSKPIADDGPWSFEPDEGSAGKVFYFGCDQLGHCGLQKIEIHVVSSKSDEGTSAATVVETTLGVVCGLGVVVLLGWTFTFFKRRRRMYEEIPLLEDALDSEPLASSNIT